MQAEGIGLEGLSRSTIERYLAQRRAAGYVEYRSLKALQPLLATSRRWVCCRFRRRSRPIRWRNCSVVTAPGCSSSAV
jgi:hypothetical protein